MLMVSPKQCNSKQALVRLWLHESMRVFHDRLVDDQDKSHFRGILLELVGKNLSSAVGSPQDLFPEGSSIIFGDFLKPGLDPAERVYEEVSLRCAAPSSTSRKKYLQLGSISTDHANGERCISDLVKCVCDTRPALPFRLTARG